MSLIHTTALVDPAAELHASVSVGPYAVIGPGVTVGEGTTIGAHCVIDGPTTIGRGNVIHPHASLGCVPQDMKYRGEPTQLIIGDRNTIFQYTTFSRGTVQDHGVTRVGNDNWIMAYVHIAHDCQLGDHVILANSVQLAGHVHLDDWVYLGGLTGVHQFVHVGAHAMSGFQTRLAQDLPPFVTAAGNPAEAQGINAEGLRRRGFSAERITQVKRMHKVLYRQGLTMKAAISELQTLRGALPEGDPDVELLLGFLAGTERGIVR